MTTVTIPKILAQKGDLVLVPRRDYDELVRRAQPVETTKRKISVLERRLDLAVANYRAGNYHGPFNSAKDAIAFLNAHRSGKK